MSFNRQQVGLITLFIVCSTKTTNNMDTEISRSHAPSYNQNTTKIKFFHPVNSWVHKNHLIQPRPQASLRYWVQAVLQFVSHAGQQVQVFIHTAAHTAVHQRPHGRLLRPGVKQILGLVVTVHCTPRETILLMNKWLVYITVFQL